MSQQINLLDARFRKQKQQFSTAAMAKALGLLAGALIALQFFAASQSRSLERLLADATRDAAQRREQLLALAKQYSAQGNSNAMEQEVARLREQLRTRNELLAEMKTGAGATTDSYSAYLEALARQTTQGVWLTGVEIGGKANGLVIRGRALRADLVPAYVGALSREPVFAGRSVTSLQVIAREEEAQGPPGGAAASARRPYLEFTLSIPLGEAAS
jgi:hypothetical protein